MKLAAQKAHEYRMKHDPLYRAELEQQARVRKMALEQYRASVDRMNRMTDDELRERFLTPTSPEPSTEKEG